MNKGISMFDLRGKTAVLSGGAGLYGRQIALALAECGAKLYIASRNFEKNQKLADELNSLGCDVHAKELDLSSEKSIIALAESVFEECGKADILINNAVMRTMQGYDDTAEAFDTSMKINATGLFLISRAFGDRMAEKGGGNIMRKHYKYRLIHGIARPRLFSLRRHRHEYARLSAGLFLS